MMIAVLSCPKTELINHSKEPWTEADTKSYKFNIKSCHRKFGDAAPCLTKFIKLGNKEYYAVCGDETNKQSRFNYFFKGE